MATVWRPTASRRGRNERLQTLAPLNGNVANKRCSDIKWNVVPSDISWCRHEILFFRKIKNWDWDASVPVLNQKNQNGVCCSGGLIGQTFARHFDISTVVIPSSRQPFSNRAVKSGSDLRPLISSISSRVNYIPAAQFTFPELHLKKNQPLFDNEERWMRWSDAAWLLECADQNFDLRLWKGLWWLVARPPATRTVRRLSSAAATSSGPIRTFLSSSNDSDAQGLCLCASRLQSNGEERSQQVKTGFLTFYWERIHRFFLSNSRVISSVLLFFSSVICYIYLGGCRWRLSVCVRGRCEPLFCGCSDGYENGLVRQQGNKIQTGFFI